MRAGCAIVLLLLAGCHGRVADYPSYGAVPAFQLTDQSGRAFDSTTLAGRVWVADFMFTSCPGPCPRMTSQMREVQEATRDLANVRLVSFTVDPERDTPFVLAEYAKLHHAETQSWYFLTGAQSALHHLGRDVFKLNNVDGTLNHSTRFVLVDARGQIRGYYDTSEPDSIRMLISDVRALANQRT
ncbi:MAG TPA: SCO family protein [Bryobacteraceae bacterium]|nr:SCO family protein [Bryobacteraceae bacterium]